jgi:hypothetical protein
MNVVNYPTFTKVTAKIRSRRRKRRSRRRKGETKE